MPGRRKGEKVEQVALEGLPAGVHSARVVNPRSGRRGGAYGTGWSPDDQIVALVSEIMARGWRDVDIHDYIRQYAGKQMGQKQKNQKRFWYDVPISSINKIKEDARTLLRDRMNLDKPLAQGMAITIYQRILNDSTATSTEKLRAQERIDAIIGSDAKFGGSGTSAAKLAQDIRDGINAINEVMEANPASEEKK